MTRPGEPPPGEPGRGNGEPGRPGQRHGRKRKTKDPLEYHGRQVITGEDLNRAFDQDGSGDIRSYRRRILHGIVLTLLVAVIIAAIVVALAIIRGDISLTQSDPPRPTAAPTPTCRAGAFSYPPNKTITLRIYNSTNRAGLASGVAAELKTRGYKVAKVGDKPMQVKIGTALIISGRSGQANAFNLQRNVPDTEYMMDTRKSTTVDVVLGEKFKSLVGINLVDHTPGPLNCR